MRRFDFRTMMDLVLAPVTKVFLLLLLATVPLLFPAVSYAQGRPAFSARGAESTGGSYSTSPNQGNTLPLAAAEALERARQYQNMGNSINRSLDELGRSLRDSFERDQRRQEEADEREERARQREEEDTIFEYSRYFLRSIH